MEAERILAALDRDAPTVLVVGDVVLDRYWEGAAERLCREGPVPVLDVARVKDAPGGAANTALNLAALGARVLLVGVAGDDEAGRALSACLAAGGVGETEASLVRRPGSTTSVKSRMVADGQLLLRVDACRRAEDGEAREVSDRALAALGEADAVVLCDYGLGALSAVDRAGLRRGARSLIIDARHLHGWSSLHADIATPNAEEAAELLGEPVPHGDRRRWAAQHAVELGAATGARHTLVTLDRDGTVLLGPAGAGHSTLARAAPEQNAVGAGDTFVAGVALGLAVGLRVEDAADLGQTAADIVVQTPGTTACARTRLTRALRGGPQKVGSVEEVLAAVEHCRRSRLDVVLTNGIFDPLHRGHTAFLEEAAGLGGLLVVGVNSDESVRRLRGSSPNTAAADRAAVVAALGAVDHAIVFDSESAVPLIHALRPDVYAKGGDYLPGMLAEASAVESLGGRLAVLGYVARPDSPTAAGVSGPGAGKNDVRGNTAL